MRVLWVNNIAIPKIAADIGEDSTPVGGWMVKLAEEISEINDIELHIVFPYKKEVNGCVKKIGYTGFSNDRNDGSNTIKSVIENFKPDIIHIFGTEYEHSFWVTDICSKNGLIDRVVISIQGLVSVYAKHYTAFLGQKVIRGYTPRDILKGNIDKGQKIFAQKGKYEIETIKKVNHVIGRTDWDKACTYFINPNAMYHFNNEMLRNVFYEDRKWSLEKCKRHTIFMSQATLPLKGLHLALEAYKQLTVYYPDLQVYIAGKSYVDKKKWKLSYYERYVIKYIKENGLSDVIHFTGFLDEYAMREQLLQANVFVSSSSIENSPNSVCEAMMLGVPVVSSMVGGVANLLEHGKEGFYYQADAPYMLAYYVKQIFDNDELASNFSIASRQKAEIRHKVEYIVDDLIDIYDEIAK